MEQRKRFEDWISSPPFELSVERYPKDETKYAWFGQYKEKEVQTAWLAWCESQGIKFNLNA